MGQTRVEAAEEMLKRVGATRVGPSAVEVTALGRHLAALPCDVFVGKLLVVGAFLGVASMAADAAAMLSVRSPLKSVKNDKKAEEWRANLRRSLLPGGTKSDHCLAAEIKSLWNRTNQARARRELCQNAGLVYERMAEANSVRAQLAAGLRGLGFALQGGDDRCDRN